MSARGPSGRRRIAGERSRTTPSDAPTGATGTGTARPKSKQARPKPGRAPAKRPVAESSGRGLLAGRRRGLGARVRAMRPPRHALRWFAPLAVVAAAAVAFAVVMGVRGVGDYREAKALDDARVEAASQAGQSAETIFGFNYARLDEHLKASKELMTPTYATKFEKISPLLTKLAPQRKVDVTATTRNAAVEECGEDCSPHKATVLVFVDQSRTTNDTQVPTIFGDRVELAMVERGGKWLVDGLSVP